MAPPPPLVKDVSRTRKIMMGNDGGASCESCVMIVMAMTVNCGGNCAAKDDDSEARSPSPAGPLHRAFRKHVFRPRGTAKPVFFSGGPPCLGNGVQTSTKPTFPDVSDLAPKARKTFFYEGSESESALFVLLQLTICILYIAAPRASMRTLLQSSKLQREQTTGTPPFCFPSVVSPI